MPLASAKSSRLAAPGCQANCLPDLAKFTVIPSGPEAADAALCLGAVSALTHDEGFDAVFDATGNANSIQSAFAHVAHGGSLVLVSVVKDTISFSDPEFHKREMMLIGSRNATREDFLHVIASIRRGEVPVNLLVTHETNVGDATKMLPHWAHEKTGLIKAVIKFAS